MPHALARPGTGTESHSCEHAKRDYIAQAKNCQALHFENILPARTAFISRGLIGFLNLVPTPTSYVQVVLVVDTIMIYNVW